MHQFLIVFVCLSTIAIAQNVVVAAPASSKAEFEIVVVSADGPGRFSSSALIHADDAPAPATMMLLIGGLSGLAAVGRHSQRRKKPPSA
jgi:hypothetical protein